VTLRGARLTDAELDLPRGDVTIADGRITAVGVSGVSGVSSVSGDDSGRIVEAQGMVVTPGFIDVHTHGGGGFSLQTTVPDEILSSARWVAASGVSGFLVGVVGVPGDLPESQLRAAVTAIEQWHADGAGGDGDGRRGSGKGAEPLGIHLEGPY